MKLTSKTARTRKWKPTTDHSVTVAEERGVRSLHIGGLAIQSAMRLSKPDALELHYTRAMMAFLLFHPAPRDLLMIGLGGGSMAKFVYRRMSKTLVRVVEIRAEVVHAARAFFDFPPDDERLQAIVADGAQYLPAHPDSTDVLLIDGFEDGVQPEALCTQAFYDAAHASLREEGVMAVNFMAEDRKLDAACARLEQSFDGRVLLLDAADKVNVVALCIKGGPAQLSWGELRRRARVLNLQFDMDFERFLETLRIRNECTPRYLKLSPSR